MISPGVLEQFGLSEKEAKVYLATLELGAASVQAIAGLAGIHRVSTYDLLESLRLKGFVFEEQRGKRRIIKPMEPAQVAAAIRSKEQLFSALVPELVALRGKSEGKPRALYFEGREGVWQAFRDCLKNRTADLETLIYGSPDQLLNDYRLELKREANSAVFTGGKSKNLQQKKNQADKTAASDAKYIGTIKYLPEDKKINGNIFIYGDKTLSISSDRLTAVVVDDKYNAENQRYIFYSLWELLS